MITDASGATLTHAWANAWAGNPEMEGMRIRVEEDGGMLTATSIHSEDREASLRWDGSELARMRDELTHALRHGEADMVNDEGEEAWQTQQSWTSPR